MYYCAVLYRKETKRLPQKLKDLLEKKQNQKIFKNRSRTSADSSLESSIKQFLRRFESNQNKSKQMKINDVFDCFTFKAYSAAIISKKKIFLSTLSAKTADSKISHLTENR